MPSCNYIACNGDCPDLVFDPCGKADKDGERLLICLWTDAPARDGDLWGGYWGGDTGSLLWTVPQTSRLNDRLTLARRYAQQAAGDLAEINVSYERGAIRVCARRPQGADVERCIERCGKR